MTREGTVDDVPLLYEMLRASAIDQGFLDQLAVTPADLVADGFGPEPHFKTLIADQDCIPAGMALYYFNYSTWGSRFGLYLEDLYVRPEFRGRGIAHELLSDLTRIAVAHKCGRMQWVVHRNNTEALRLYESFGGQAASDWSLMSLRGDALRK